MIQNDRYADGFKLVNQGLSIDPTNYLLHYNAARVLWMCGLPRECLSYLTEATRLSISSQLFRPDFPEWDGEPIAGCEFLYVLHQGYGDQIQFLRLAQWLHQQGATVDVFVDAPLAGIAAGLPGVRAVYSYPTAPTGPYTYWSYMMRVPAYMGLKLSMLPLAMPYVSTTPQRREHWRRYVGSIAPRLPNSKNRRVGFVWKGSPNTGNDRFRSIQLEALRPLFELPSITWFSLQKGNAEEESRSLAGQFDVHTLGPAIEDFTDTLAILETFDLAITVDSSVAHLAGAAGLPVWVLLPGYSEWRWLADRTDSPWYPSMRLFRQQYLRQWKPVIGELREALREWLDKPLAAPHLAWSTADRQAKPTTTVHSAAPSAEETS